jgi:hypothetical protein
VQRQLKKRKNEINKLMHTTFVEGGAYGAKGKGASLEISSLAHLIYYHFENRL